MKFYYDPARTKIQCDTETRDRNRGTEEDALLSEIISRDNKIRLRRRLASSSSSHTREHFNAHVVRRYRNARGKV